MKARILLITTMAALSMALWDCGPKPEDEETDETLAADSVDTATTTASFVTLASDPAAGAATPEGAATMAGASVMTGTGTYLQPPGCATASVNRNVVTYMLTDCTGPYGLVHVSGRLVATFAHTTGGGVNVTITGTDVRVNGATLAVNATAVVTGPQGNRTAMVNSTSRGTGGRGRVFAHSGNYTVTWDAAGHCLDLSGNFSTAVGAVGWTTTIENFHKCGSGCPRSGGRVTLRGPARSVTLSFDGTATATWSTGTGRTGRLPLYCM